MQAALQQWNAADAPCVFLHIGDIPHRLFNGFRERYPLGDVVRLWFAGDTLIAFVMIQPVDGTYEALIAPALRGTAYERDIHRWAYRATRTWLDRLGKADTPIITDAADCDPHTVAMLTGLGFTPENQPWLVTYTRLLAVPIPEVALPEGFTIRGAQGDADAEQLAAVHSSAFDSNWTADLYRDEVMHKPGYIAENERVVVAPDGRFAAFCLLWLDDVNHSGLFEPVGTHADFQRRGLGKALMADCLHWLHSRGMQIAYVTSERDNPASNALYQKLGFSPQIQFTAYSRL